jgi:toxin CcdB
MQYTVYRNTSNSKEYPYLLDVQSDIIDILNTRLVIPLFLRSEFRGNYPMRICPLLDIEGAEYLVMTHEMASVRLSLLGAEVVNVAHHRKSIRDAIDFLVDGF